MYDSSKQEFSFADNADSMALNAAMVGRLLYGATPGESSLDNFEQQCDYGKFQQQFATQPGGPQYSQQLHE